MCFQEIQESIRNREPQLNLIRKQSGEFVSHGRQIMEPYKRLLDRRWDDLSLRIRELEGELEDAKRQAEQARAMGGRVETEIIVTVTGKRFFPLFFFLSNFRPAFENNETNKQTTDFFKTIKSAILYSPKNKKVQRGCVQLTGEGLENFFSHSS